MKKIGLLKLITLYKILRDSLDMIKPFTYPAVKMHPNAKNIAPMHVLTEFFIDSSLFLKNEKKAKKGIRDIKIKIKIRNNNAFRR
jgi:hypothetical protein